MPTPLLRNSRYISIWVSLPRPLLLHACFLLLSGRNGWASKQIEYKKRKRDDKKVQKAQEHRRSARRRAIAAAWNVQLRVLDVFWHSVIISKRQKVVVNVGTQHLKSDWICSYQAGFRHLRSAAVPRNSRSEALAATKIIWRFQVRSYDELSPLHSFEDDYILSLDGHSSARRLAVRLDEPSFYRSAIGKPGLKAITKTGYRYKVEI